MRGTSLCAVSIQEGSGFHVTSTETNGLCPVQLTIWKKYGKVTFRISLLNLNCSTEQDSLLTHCRLWATDSVTNSRAGNIVLWCVSEKLTARPLPRISFPVRSKDLWGNNCRTALCSLSRTLLPWIFESLILPILLNSLIFLLQPGSTKWINPSLIWLISRRNNFTRQNRNSRLSLLFGCCCWIESVYQGQVLLTVVYAAVCRSLSLHFIHQPCWRFTTGISLVQ